MPRTILLTVTTLVLPAIIVADIAVRRADRSARTELAALTAKERHLGDRLLHAPHAEIANAAFPANPTPPAGRGQRPRLQPEPLVAPPDLATLQARARAASRAKFASQYGPFFRRLHLTPDQIAAFESAQLDFENKSIDSATLSLMESQVLGGDAYWKLQQYERTLPVRTYIDDLILQTAVTPAPLTAATADQLTQILADASTAYQNGAAARPYDLNWQQVCTRAKPLLTPSQFSSLQAIAAPQQWLNERIVPMLAQAARPR